MSVPAAPDMEGQLSGLLDDPGFQKLHGLMNRFNLFEAVGAVRGELIPNPGD